MVLGYTGGGRFTNNVSEVATLILTKYSSYEIVNPLSWHSVIPLESTYTVMVNDCPWDAETVAHQAVRRTKGKDLDKMPEEELIQHLQVFKELLKDFIHV